MNDDGADGMEGHDDDANEEEEEHPDYKYVHYHWDSDECALDGDSVDSDDSGGVSDDEKPDWMKSPSFRKFYRRWLGIRDEREPVPKNRTAISPKAQSHRMDSSGSSSV